MPVIHFFLLVQNTLCQNTNLLPAVAEGALIGTPGGDLSDHSLPHLKTGYVGLLLLPFLPPLPSPNSPKCSPLVPPTRASLILL